MIFIFICLSLQTIYYPVVNKWVIKTFTMSIKYVNNKITTQFASKSKTTNLPLTS